VFRKAGDVGLASFHCTGRATGTGGKNPVSDFNITGKKGMSTSKQKYKKSYYKI
jgi:hypothetical protein